MTKNVRKRCAHTIFNSRSDHTRTRKHWNSWRLGLCSRPDWGSLQRSPCPPS